MKKPRKAGIDRKTRETRIRIALDLDGKGTGRVKCPIGFFGHMLEAFARHGAFDLTADIAGDFEVDQHHAVEDAGIALGEAFRRALGDRRGIRRAGSFLFPMDESLARAAVDLSGRPFLRFDIRLRSAKLGDWAADTIEDFFQGFASALGASFHLAVEYGRSDHHKAEALFKAFGRAMRQACERDGRTAGRVPSTKGVL
ncbi:MAG: imidazoleglycerol-phosphate dehydratase HisB [Candidatus Aminicenantes bacterium]|nr:imidazoleglycerol-phosphate dehydratase HisB [Candidatus Aminicenantes bacterium]